MQKAVLAKMMGKQKQAMNSLITDAKWSTIEQIADAMGISTQELLFDRSYDKPTSGNFTCPKCGAGIRLKIEAD